MPEGRIVLKAISDSKKLSNLKTDGARLLYTWLIPHVNIDGCYSADPDVIKGKILTRLKKTTETVENYLDDLEENKLIIRYVANGDVFLIVPDFIEKQPSLNPNREAKPTIPTPTPDLLRSYSNTSKVKQSKVKESKDKAENVEKEFDEFWNFYRSIGNEKDDPGGKQEAMKAYKALRKNTSKKEIANAAHGYGDYLKAKKEYDGFVQRKKFASTWLRSGRWEEHKEFRYKAKL